MEIAAWVVQVLLALTFGMAGFLKATQPVDKISERMEWVKDFAPGTIRAIGILEILAAIGLIAPALTRILPWLTPLAAVGLVLTMIGAAVVHARRGEYSAIGMNTILLLMAAFVAYARFAVVPVV